MLVVRRWSESIISYSLVTSRGWAWAFNQTEQLGNSSYTLGTPSYGINTPVQVVELSVVNATAGGDDHSLAGW